MAQDGGILIGVDIDDNNIDKDIKRLQGKLGKSFSNMGRHARDLALGIGAVGAALFGIANKASETALRVGDMSEQLGFSIEKFQDWDFMLKSVGSSADVLGESVDTLLDKMMQAREGSEEATMFFNKLGISINDLKTLSRQDIFDRVVKGLRGLDNETEKAFIANELLSGSYQELLPILNMTDDEFAELSKQASIYGRTVDEEAIKSAEEFRGTMQKLNSVMETASIAVLKEVTELVSDLADKGYFDRLAEGVAFVGDNFTMLFEIGKLLFGLFASVKIILILKSGFDALVVTVGALSSAFSYIGPVVGGVAAAIGGLSAGAIAAIAAIITVVGWMILDFEGFMDFLGGFGDFMMNLFADIGDAVSNAFDAVLEFFGLAGDDANIDVSKSLTNEDELIARTTLGRSGSSQSNTNVNVNVTGNTFSNKRDIDNTGTEMVKRLKQGGVLT